MKSFFWWWEHRLPCPFTAADRRAGYVHELAVRQFEVSNTRVHPASPPPPLTCTFTTQDRDSPETPARTAASKETLCATRCLAARTAR